jgi:hypothetical protein
MTLLNWKGFAVIFLIGIVYANLETEETNHATQFNFELNGRHFQFYPIKPALTQFEVLILYPNQRECKLSYFDWVRRDWDWTVELAIDQNLTFKTSNGHVFYIDCGEGTSGESRVLLLYSLKFRWRDVFSNPARLAPLQHQPHHGTS